MMLFHELEDLEKMALVSSEGDIFNVMSGLYTGCCLSLIQTSHILSK